MNPAKAKYHIAYVVDLESKVQQLTGERDAALEVCRKAGVGDYKADYFLGQLTETGKLRQERDAALKVCVEMRDVIAECEWRGHGSERIVSENFICPICKAYGPDCYNIPHQSNCKLKHALSSDGGKGYHHDDEWKVVVEALRVLYKETTDYIRINHLGDVHHNQSMKNAREALAHAAKLMGKDKE